MVVMDGRGAGVGVGPVPSGGTTGVAEKSCVCGVTCLAVVALLQRSCITAPSVLSKYSSLMSYFLPASSLIFPLSSFEA